MAYLCQRHHFADTSTRSDPEFDPDLYVGVCRIAPKTKWIHILVGISHFTKFRKQRPVTVQ